jgi:hypothetical protein
MELLKRASTYLLCIVFALSGCVTNSGGPDGAFEVGPQLSSFFETKRPAEIDESKQRLEIIVPVFDPGLSADAKTYEEEGIWPELRRAEANRFAYKLKTELEETGAFGAVRVVPDGTAMGDLYIFGKIIESNGEDVEIEIKVVDISGRHWFTRRFDHTVKMGFYKDIRTDDTYPYEPVFEAAANRVAVALESIEEKRLTSLKRIAELRFGSHLAEDGFAGHLGTENGETTLISFPSEDDTMLKRTRAIQIRDQLFVDNLQDNYRSFSRKMEASYLVWQKQSLTEIEAKREVQSDAAGKAVLGVLAIGLAVAAIAAGANSNNPNLGLLGGTVACASGTALLIDSFKTSEEAKVHRDALSEVGESINLELGPQVVAFEEETIELVGDAKEQFAQWRSFLKKIYDQERTPKVRL